MSGRPLPRFQCECAACAARADDEWARFVDGHQEAADAMRVVFLNPDRVPVPPVRRLQEYLAHTRATGAVEFEDGA